MDRIKSRLALIVATAALAGVFMAPPAAATDDCDYPQAVCHGFNVVFYCVWMPIHTGSWTEGCAIQSA